MASGFDDRHPRYPNPTIVEALCEIHFSMPDDRPWTPARYGEFFLAVRDEFPNMEPLSERSLRVEYSIGGRLHEFSRRPQRVRFTSPDRAQIIQVGYSAITVNYPDPYPGWEEMKPGVLDIWQRAIEVFDPESVARIGLRYINRIPTGGTADGPGVWLAPSEYVPGAIATSKSEFSSRVECSLTDTDHIVVTVFVEEADNAESNSIIFLDIDRISEKAVSVSEHDVSGEMERLHSHVWDVFQQSHTPRLLELLKGESDANSNG